MSDNVKNQDQVRLPPLGQVLAGGGPIGASEIKSDDGEGYNVEGDDGESDDGGDGHETAAEETRKIRQLRETLDEQNKLIKQQKRIIAQVEAHTDRINLENAWKDHVRSRTSELPVQPIRDRCQLWQYDHEDDVLRYDREVARNLPMSVRRHELADLEIVTNYNKRLIAKLETSIDTAGRNRETALSVLRSLRRWEDVHRATVDEMTMEVDQSLAKVRRARERLDERETLRATKRRRVDEDSYEH
ncbi:hypothetical protein AYO20_09101 [Fonsecaea nubica]|uniref:Uncharacterized protein n=1 Tax=Fonsecaea nubica TaxID=856822 RepID=A0A178CJN8_9EURO|nr:hypothetical protein AYO20_09101 [Fonsecaea nubica]OAL29717.1 hypothetical protein AYO20_09101 [Fonsecaea nubica]